MKNKLILLIICISILIVILIAFMLNNKNQNRKYNEKQVMQEKVEGIQKNKINEEVVNVIVKTDENGNQKFFTENGYEIPSYMDLLNNN